MRFRFLLLFLLAAFGASGQVALYVDSSKAVSGTGTSWATAYKTLGEALNVANGAGTAVAYNVYIAKGTYYPTGVQSGMDRDSSFVLLRGGLRVYGGYPTGGGVRNVLANPTVLSGAIGNANDSTDNSYHVVVVSKAGNGTDSTVLDGLSITRGAANAVSIKIYGSTNVWQYAGGGMVLVTGSRISVKGCRFYNNYALMKGGGLYTMADSAQVTGCTFTTNASRGGGSVCEGGAINTAASSVLPLTGCTFTGNYSEYFGGAVFSSSPSALPVNDCSFAGNVAVDQGGAIYFAGAQLTADFLVSNSTFSGNTAADHGGAIQWGSSSASSYSGRLRACSFTGNISSGTIGGGGAISYWNGSLLRIDTCQFTGNKTVNAHGGAIFASAPIAVTGSTFQNDSTVGGNIGNAIGGAVYAGNVTATSSFSGCTFTGNYAKDNGGAVFIDYTNTSSFTDCTFDGNTAAQNGGALFVSTALPLNRCRIRGNRAGISGGGLYMSTIANTANSFTNTVFSGNYAVTSGGAAHLRSLPATTTNTLTLTNCTMASDSAASGRGLYLESQGTNAWPLTFLNSIFREGVTNSISFVYPSTLSATYSNLQTTTVLPGAGNSNSNPLFVGALAASAAPTTGGNYALTACSPAINAGLNSGSYTGVLDVAGNARLAGTSVDQGAYEFQPSTVAGTISGLSSGTLCTGKTAQLTASVSGGTWSNPAPALVTVSSTGLVTAGTTPGTDTVLYTVLSGNCPVQVIQAVTVLAPPAVTAITGAATVCANGSTQLGNATTGGTWSSTNTAVATVSTTGLVTGVAAGTVTIRYKVTNAGGCADSVSKALTVVAAPVVTAITGSGLGVCPGGTLQLFNSTNGGVWGNTCTAGALTVSSTGLVTGITTGFCTVTYTVTNSSGCATTVSRSTTVYGTPSPSITGTAVVCAGKSTLYSASPAGGTWSVANPAVATVSGSGVLTGTAAGTTILTYTYTNGAGCTGTASQAVTVNPTVAQSITASLCASGPGYPFGNLVLTTAGTYTQTFAAANGCDSVVTLTLTGTPPADTTVLAAGGGLVALDTTATYQWVRCEPNGTQTPLPGKTGRLFVAPASGSYALVVTKNGCAATSGCHAVTVAPPAGIGGAPGAGWALYPNPTTGRVTVQTGTATARSLTVCDATGKQLLQVQPAGPETILDLSGYAPGLYLISLQDAAGAGTTLRVTLTGSR